MAVAVAVRGVAGSPSQTASVQPQLPVGLIDTRAIFSVGPLPPHPRAAMFTVLLARAEALP